IPWRESKPYGNPVVFVGAGRRRSDPRQSGPDLATLMREPARRMRQIGTKAALVNNQDRGIDDSVGEPRQRERPIALPSAQRQQPVGAGDVLQILNDDAAVVDRTFVGQHETGHLAKRVLLLQRIVLVEGISGADS